MCLVVIVLLTSQRLAFLTVFGSCLPHHPPKVFRRRLSAFCVFEFFRGRFGRFCGFFGGLAFMIASRIVLSLALFTICVFSADLLLAPLARWALPRLCNKVSSLAQQP